MRVLCGTILMMMALGAAGAGWTPGSEYAGGATTSTNAVYDPFHGNLLPLSPVWTVVGKISSNDVAIFTDKSGRFVRGTNLIGQVQGWAIEATTGATAQASAALAKALDAELAAYQAKAAASNAQVTADAALPKIATNGWETGSHATWITNETTTLATAATRGDFAGTETITPLRVGSTMFGPSAGSYASGVNWGAYGKSAGGGASGDTWGAYGYYAGWLASGTGWGAYGYYAGNGASGTGWGAYGYQAGTGASGTGWGAYGVGSGSGASGTSWGAYGYQAGLSAIWTNSHAFGSYAGYQATGNARLYIDVYSGAPASASGTGDMIYGDNGQLNLGRTGALTNSAPNQLRGRWQGNASELTGIVLATGGTASNLTATGTLTLGGEARTNWPTATGGSSSTLVPIVAVTTGAVTTVTWSATPQIAYVDLYTQTTLTNSLPTLNCTSNMSAEVWVNAAVTNALAPLWDSRIEWQDGTPDMTVTGLYKFAFSSACGTKIHGEQIYPEVYEWNNLVIASGNGAASASDTRKVLLSAAVPASTTTNSFGAIVPLDATLVKITCYGGGMIVPVLLGAGRGLWNAVPAVDDLAPLRLIGTGSAFARDVYFVSPARTSYMQTDYIMVSCASNSTTSWQMLGLHSRRLNYLESKAYAAGWRP